MSRQLRSDGKKNHRPAESSIQCPSSVPEPSALPSTTKRNRTLDDHNDREEEKNHSDDSRNRTAELHLLHSRDDTSSRRKLDGHIPNNEQEDQGFVRAKQVTPVGARFRYSCEDESQISSEFLSGNGLLPRAHDSTIMLSFWLDSKPEKIYKLVLVLFSPGQSDQDLSPI
jgi:hypothetical protein